MDTGLSELQEECKGKLAEELMSCSQSQWLNKLGFSDITKESRRLKTKKDMSIFCKNHLGINRII